MKAVLKRDPSMKGVYAIWSQMIQRCSNPKAARYKNYGARGIKVCDRWRVFDNFFCDMGERPSYDHSIDRIDNDGDYCKENCRWATREQQYRNKTNSRILLVDGVAMTAAEVARKLGVDESTIHGRIRNGWSLDETVKTPKQDRYDVRSKKYRASRQPSQVAGAQQV